MKMDQLEKFVVAHREDFDVANPDPGIWSAIESKLPSQRSREVAMWRWIAAAAVGLVLIMSGFILGLRMDEDPGVGISAEYEEFLQAEQYYKIQINDRMNALGAYEPDDGLQSDIRELEGSYDELAKELNQGWHPNQQEILKALIQNYQTRIDLLERVLDRVEEGQAQSQNIIEEDENIKL